ncbi:MAG: DNA internalization-related competence protein ComEC/Rec2, partial [Micrococcales bacterium]
WHSGQGCAVIPVIWAGALSTWLLAQSMVSREWAKWLIAIVVVTLAVAVSHRFKPKYEQTNVTLLVGFVLLFTFTSANASLADAASSPEAVVAQAQTYSTIECIVRVTDVDRYRTAAEVTSTSLPAFSAFVVFKDDVRAVLVLGQRFEGSFRIKPSHRDSPKFVLAQTGTLRELSPQPSWLDTVRSNFTRIAKSITPDSGALVAGLAIGDDSALSSQMLTRMKTLSLTHLTAVSGANCAIVIAGVFLLLKRAGSRRGLTISLSLLALVLYVAVVGFEPSVIRAAVMASVVLLCTFAGRRVPPTVALAWAVVLVLTIWPSMVKSLGFWLSVMATAAILLISPVLYKKLSTRMPAGFALGLAVVVSAQLWCLPMLVDLSGGLPTYSVIANLLAEPLVAPITVFGILALVVAMVFPPLATLLYWLASFAAYGIELISNLALLPAATIWWPEGVLGIVLMMVTVAALSLMIISRMRRQALAGIALVTLTFVSFSGSAVARSQTWPGANWQIVSCDVGQGDATVIRSLNQTMLIDVGREPEPIENCLQSLGVKQIDLLLLTHFDADHVGGLSGALGMVRISQALISPFDDDRPQVRATLDQLAQENVPVSTAEVGDSGLLGEANWMVVSPEPGASGAEDSNDASVIMRVETSQWLLLAFADAGERAQMRVVRNRNTLLNRASSKPLIVKVSHHGSADQYAELFEDLRPELALFSVGATNNYGHPTQRAIGIFENAGSKIFRTDQQGAIAIGFNDGLLKVLTERER